MWGWPTHAELDCMSWQRRKYIHGCCKKMALSDLSSLSEVEGTGYNRATIGIDLLHLV